MTQVALQLLIEIIEYILALAFQPLKLLVPTEPIYTIILEEFTAPCLFLLYKFHRKYCSCGHSSISENPCCCCNDWDCCYSDVKVSRLGVLGVIKTKLKGAVIAGTA
jgi:hypothetical protein